MTSSEMKSDCLAKLENLGQPVIGLEYIVEIFRHTGDFDYRCELCSEALVDTNVIEHVLTVQHRLSYLKNYFPSAFSKFSSMPPDGHEWKKHNVSFLELIVRKIESTFGRLKPTSVIEEDLDPSIVQKIQQGNHLRESDELDFENMTNPFIPSKGSLDHIEDPDMHDLMKREIQRFRQGQKASSDAPNSEMATRLNALKDGLSDEERKIFEKHRAKGDNDEVLILTEKRVSNKLMKPFREIQPRTRKSPNRESPSQSSHRSRRQNSPQEVRKRSRSKSPYEQQHRRWTKFSVEFQALESRSKRSHEIFIQRPEDHPAYPEEWGLFWERRYQELLDEGKDPEKHDFKQEWIPFWTNRSQEIFSTELKIQKEALLKKYELETDEEPKKQSVKEGSPSRKKESRLSSESNQRRTHQRKSSPLTSSETRFKQDRNRSPRRRLSRSRSKERERGYRRSPAFRSRRSPDVNWRSQDHNPSGFPLGERRSPSWQSNDQRGPRVPYGSRPYSPEMHSRRSRSPPMYPSSRSRSPRFFQRNRSRSPVDFFSNRSRSPTFYRTQGPDWQPNWNTSSVVRSPGRHHNRERSPGYSSWDSPPRLRLPSHEKEISRMGSSPPRRPTPENNGIMGVLRVLIALENTLGSLAPQVNALMARVMALENEKNGSSNRLLENPDIAAILEMAKEKLGGLVVSGLLADNQGLAARLCIDQLNEVLSNATRKRPFHLPDLTKKPEPETPPEESKEDQMKKLRCMFAEMLSKELMKRGKSLLSDQKLHKLVYEITKGTELDDGSLESPPPTPPPTPPQVAPEPPPVAVVHNPEMFLDIYDELTCEELQAMLEGFEKLQKSEQLELIAYIKKLEKTDPQKLQKIKNPGTPAPIPKPPPPKDPNHDQVQQMDGFNNQSFNQWMPSQQQNTWNNPSRQTNQPSMQASSSQGVNRPGPTGPQQVGQVRYQGHQYQSQPNYQHQGQQSYQFQGQPGSQPQGQPRYQHQGQPSYQQQAQQSNYQQQGQAGYPNQGQRGYESQDQTGHKQPSSSGLLNRPQYGHQDQPPTGLQHQNPTNNQPKPLMGFQNQGQTNLQFQGQTGFRPRLQSNFPQRPIFQQPMAGNSMNQTRQQWNPNNPPLPANQHLDVMKALAGPPPPPPPPTDPNESADKDVPLVTSSYGYGTPKEPEVTKGYTTYNYGKNQQTGYQTQSLTPQFNNPRMTLQQQSWRHHNPN